MELRMSVHNELGCPPWGGHEGGKLIINSIAGNRLGDATWAMTFTM